MPLPPPTKAKPKPLCIRCKSRPAVWDKWCNPCWYAMDY